MWNRVVSTVVASVMLATPCVTAQIVDSEHLVPIVARTVGAGDPPTRWVSDLVVMNLHDQPLEVGMMYFPWGADRITDWDFTFPVTFVLAPLETRIVEDVLGTIFGYTGDTKGALMVTCDSDTFPSNPPEAEMLTTSRTYNTGAAAGTFGQTVMPLDLFTNMTSEPSYVAGARHDSRFRSNLGVMNLSPEAIDVHYRIRDAAGSIVVEGSKHLEVFDGGQWSFGELGVDVTSGPLRVELWLDPADVTPDVCAVDWFNSFVAYVSKVDGNPSGTGDAEFLPAVPADFPPPDVRCDDG